MSDKVDVKQLVEKWNDVLDHDKFDKLNDKMKKMTAIVLENEQKYIVEASGATSWASNSLYPTGTDFSNNGVFYNIAVPMVRRTFPELIAHDLVGVQPMTGPAGVAFALRYKAGQAYTNTTVNPTVGYAAGEAELGYNVIDKNYSGSHTTSAGEALGSKVGSGVGNDIGLGVGAGTHIKEIGLTIEKATVSAVTRKLRARWSVELQQDLKAMHGIDAESEMMDILSYEITAEIDRELIDQIRSVATSGNWDFNASTASTGRWEAEKYRAMYNRAVREANKIAVSTRRGSGNWIVASPSVCAALESLSNFTISPVASDINTALTGVARIGSIDGRFMLYRDTFAPDDQMLIGYKGPSPLDTGVVYLPYIQLMMNKITFEDSMQPAMGLMSRYGIHSHIFGSGLFYRVVKILNLPT